MNAYRDFGPFDGKIWLNVASEGPIPHTAMEALKDAVEWKLQPFQLTVTKFLGVPQQLRQAIGNLIHADPHDIILGNSATYGIKPSDTTQAMAADGCLRWCRVREPIT